MHCCHSSTVGGIFMIRVKVGGQEKCMPELGCFHSGPPFFDPVYRPVSLLPQDRDDVATAFLLYTRDSPFFFQFLRAGEQETIIRSSYRLGAETKFIVPGWLDNMKISNWMQDMKDALLNYEDCNVIIVDWSQANGIPFALAVANTRVVGAEIALLVNFLQDYFGEDPEDFHIIGHSLGTEVAGYAGERINNLGRITALDPAGPYFRNVSIQVRLDPSDALFVDAIHAQASDDDFDTPSRMQQTGHIDFYPNGGASQPGCPSSIIGTFKNRGILEGAKNLIVCDHYRVIEYFLATIPNHYGCRPVGVACDSWHSYISGRCPGCGKDGSRCAVMGFQSDIKQKLIQSYPPRKFYLFTSKKPPFCVQSYHISVKIGTLVSSFGGSVGTLHVTLIGKYKNVTSHVNKKNSLLRPGMVYTTIATSNEDILVHAVSFRWQCATLQISEGVRLSVEKPSRCLIHLHSIIVTTYKEEMSDDDLLVMCGPKFPIPQNIEIGLGIESLC